MERDFLCSFTLGEDGEGVEGKEGASSGSDVWAGLAMLMLELDLEGRFAELDRWSIFLWLGVRVG